MRIGSFQGKGSQWTKHFSLLQQKFPQHEFLEGDAACQAIETLDAAIYSPYLQGDTLASAKHLKAVFAAGTGLNHLPMETLKARGIKVFNVHGQAPSVAQCALAMILAFYGRTIEFHNDLKNKQWHGLWVGKSDDSEWWHSLFGRTCTIFGMGAIGLTMAKLLKAFDCTITGFRRHPVEELPPYFDAIATDFQRAVNASELLIVALPLTPQTRGLFTREVLMGCKDKFLVNVGRGDIIDEEGLFLALKEGVLKGAAIDTWYTYPRGGTEGAPSRFPIHELPNVILSPHVGGSSFTGIENIVRETIENISLWLSTGTSPRLVDQDEGY